MKNVELLLVETVENLGIVGDVVKVKSGYARNYLLPFGYATVPSEEKIAELAERRAQVEAELKQKAAAQDAMIQKLDGYELTLERSANDAGILYGGVSQHDIAAALREAEFDVEDRYVRLGQTIRRLDTYEVPVVINKELKTEIKVWVVSDRPMDLDEEVEAAEASGEGGDAGDDAEVNVPQSASDKFSELTATSTPTPKGERKF
ncbi:MAG: 50S ribosomal protein L9 [Planctomycetota bacterium]